MSTDRLAAKLDNISAQMGIELSPAAALTLASYAELVLKWQAITNLTAALSPTEFVEKHIADCLAVTPYMRTGRLLDIGSGAGLPGVVLAIVCPQLAVTLLEPRSRRARFLLQAKIELGLDNVDVVGRRLQSYQPPLPFDMAITKAFGALANFVSAAARLRAEGTQLCAMKGALDAAELAAGEALAGTARVIRLNVPGFDSRTLVVFSGATAAAEPN